MNQIFISLFLFLVLILLLLASEIPKTKKGVPKTQNFKFCEISESCINNFINKMKPKRFFLERTAYQIMC